MASHAAGEGVIRGCSGVAAAGLRGAGEAEMTGRRANSRGGRVFNIMMSVVAEDSPSGGRVRSRPCGAMHCSAFEW